MPSRNATIAAPSCSIGSFGMEAGASRTKVTTRFAFEGTSAPA
jgi:hypothetical protein